MEFNLQYRLLSEGRNEEYKVQLKPEVPYTIGRQGEGLQLFDPSVSRIHCMFILEGEDLFVVDDSSTNGTFFLGKRITKQKVVNGDSIKLGVYTIEFIQVPFMPLEEPSDSRTLVQKPVPVPKPPPVSMVSAPAGVPKNKHPALMDHLDLSAQGIFNTYKTVGRNPFGFFEDLRLTGSVRKSCVLIVSCSLLVNVVQIVSYASAALISMTGLAMILKLLAGIIVAVLLGTITMVVEIAIAVYILEILSGFLGASGRFEEYLRFMGYVTLVAVPCQIATNLTLGIAGALIFMLLLAWTVIGFLRAFGAKFGPTVAVFIVLFLTFGILEKYSLERFNPFMFTSG